MLNERKSLFFSSLFVFFSASVFGVGETTVDDATLSVMGNGKNWAAFGRNYSEQRYSPLTKVNTESVKGLGLDWYMDLPDDRSLTGTPLVVDGVIYFTGSYSKTRAVDAKTGELIWEYDPESIKHAGDRLKVMWDRIRAWQYGRIRSSFLP